MFSCMVNFVKNKQQKLFLLQVLFLDYGNQERVACDKICIPTEQVAKFAIQATRARLQGVYPLLGSTWDEDAVSRFNELIAQPDLTGKITKVRVD